MTRRCSSRPKRGFSLILMALSAVGMIGGLGLASDLGRIYIARTELQAYADAAASLAAYELDGTSAGITRARTAATAGPGTGTDTNKWYFGTKTVSNVTVTFSESANGPYSSTPLIADNVRFVRVVPTTPMPMYFLPILPGVAQETTVNAEAVAGQGTLTSLGAGLDPFSPDAQNAADPNFGFTVGQWYTLKWAPPGQRKKAGGKCAGDASFDAAGGASDRGYINIGQGNGNSALHDAIVNGNYSLASPMTVGSYIDTVTGNKHVGPALGERFAQDTDQVSSTINTYAGNGRRILIVPVNDHTPAGMVVGFAQFLLNSNSWGSNNAPVCGIYMGNTALLRGTHKSAGPPGLHAVMLFR